jgi:hypothetical protein
MPDSSIGPVRSPSPPLTSARIASAGDASEGRRTVERTASTAALEWRDVDAALAWSEDVSFDWTPDAGGTWYVYLPLVKLNLLYFPPHKQPDGNRHSVTCHVTLVTPEFEAGIEIPIAQTEVWGETKKDAEDKAAAWVDAQIRDLHRRYAGESET